MAPNNEQHCEGYEENYIEASAFDEFPMEHDADDDNSDDDWKRLARYIAGIVLFFYVLFKYLI